MRILRVIALLALSSCSFAQTFSVVYTFKGYPNDAGNPYGGVVRDKSGNLFGVSLGGGTHAKGAIYKITPTGEESVLHSLTTGQGDLPFDRLTLDPAGNLYGTAGYGGFADNGTVFEWKHSGEFAVLHRFGQGNYQDGTNPCAGVVIDAEGNLYGTAPYAGPFNNGAVYKITPDGHESVLYGFGAAVDGSFPQAPLLKAHDGSFYGTTALSGTAGYGTVFKLTPDGVETLLYNFQGYEDGRNPAGKLAEDGEGNLYGTTSAGGSTGQGVLFKIDRHGKETVLFDGIGVVLGGLVIDPQGNLYGADSGGVFKVDPLGNYTQLYVFSPGSLAHDSPILAADGNLYGATYSGGDPDCDCGIVYKITL
ncbi:MAG: hypothetical protein H0X25_17195 [Acidobacteriales bacterium]|nr:hypothetical protein [Terriglobales bacterium]